MLMYALLLLDMNLILKILQTIKGIEKLIATLRRNFTVRLSYLIFNLQ